MEETVNIWHESSNRTTPSWSMCQSFQSENHYTGNTQMSEMTCQYLGCFMRSMWTQTRIERRRTNRTKLSKPNPPPPQKKPPPSKVARQLVPRQKKEGEKNKKSVGEERKKKKQKEKEDCWAGAILDVICLLGDGAPALKSPLGARIVWEEPAIFCSIIYHCHHIMIPLAAPYWCL